MLNNKVIVVTGGAGLIGQEFVRTIVQNGGTAVIADIDIMNANKVKEGLLKEYQTSNIDVIEFDINSENSIQDAIDYLDNKYHKIDEYQDFCENTNLHLGGYFLTSQKFIRYFVKQGSGNIVNISSIYGVITPRFEIYKDTEMGMPVEYAVIKAALIHLTKYMAKYCQDKNIRINVMSPGGVLDGQPQLFLDRYNANCASKGMLDKQDLGGTLLYLLSDMSKYVNGQNIVIDDGFSL